MGGLLATVRSDPLGNRWHHLRAYYNKDKLLIQAWASERGVSSRHQDQGQSSRGKLSYARVLGVAPAAAAHSPAEDRLAHPRDQGEKNAAPIFGRPLRSDLPLLACTRAGAHAEEGPLGTPPQLKHKAF